MSADPIDRIPNRKVVKLSNKRCAVVRVEKAASEPRVRWEDQTLAACEELQFDAEIPVRPRDLARYMGVSRATARRRLRKLISRGMLNS